MTELLEALADWRVAVVLREPGVAYPLVNAAHIISLGLIIGAITTLDLRLLGLFRSRAISELGPPLSAVAASGVVFAVVTGTLLFSVQPREYADNSAFLVKLALVFLAVLNAGLVRLLPYWQRALAGQGVDVRLKLSAGLSLLLWTSAIVSGRWIGFL